MFYIFSAVTKYCYVVTPDCVLNNKAAALWQIHPFYPACSAFVSLHRLQQGPIHLHPVANQIK